MVLFSPIRRLRNLKRRIIKRNFDFAYLQIPAEFENRQPPSRPFFQRLIFPESTISLEYVEKLVKRLITSTKGKGIIIELPLDFSIPIGLINQIHSILIPLKQSGRKIVIISKQYDLKTYALASIADSILLVPGGILDVRGLSSTIPFFKNGLAKLGLEFEKIAVSGYKAAFDNFTRESISPEYKENIEWLQEGQIEILGSILNEQRKIEMDSLLENAPYTEDEALSLGFIDGILRSDELPTFLENIFSLKKTKILPFNKIHKCFLIPANPSESVAVIPVIGTIIDGNSRSSPPISPPVPVPLVGENQTGDNTIIQMIREVLKNPLIVGTILFVDSPGGSALASETIRSALTQLQKKMPVVAYFNSVAASGGYYISTACQWIIAEPACVTGSIGVVNGRISIKNFMKNNNMSTETIKIGKNADWGNIFDSYSESEKKSAVKIMNSLYDRFLTYVAENRAKTKEEIMSIAGGRVYTGTQSKENGLIDQIGSLNDAFNKVCKLAGKKTNLELLTIHPVKDSFIPPTKIKERSLFNFSENFFANMTEYLKPFVNTTFWMLDTDYFLFR